MSKKLLIATLGTAPPVVTEALDLLKSEGIKIDGIHLLMTQDLEVKEACELLVEHIAAHDRITWIEPHSVGVYGDVDTAIAAVEFMQQACQVLKTYRDAGYDLFVSIAGGRKAMSALLTLAVQFYGARRLFHIWVPPWLEEEGDITKLRNLREFQEQLTQALHPSLDVAESDRPRLVDLPFIGLFPLLPEILSGLKGNQVSREIRKLLQENNLLSPQGSTELGRAVAKILEVVETLPPARQGDCDIQIRDHHGKKELLEFARRLCARFPFVTRIESIAWGGEGVKTKPPNQIELHTRKICMDIPAGLCLTTTATEQGQLEAVLRVIRQFVNS